ncbi:unnamed protein product [Discula destructiva]
MSSATKSSSGSSIAESSANTYSKWSVSTIKALQTWYEEETGLWLSTGWWNSANCITVLGDFYAANADGAEHLELDNVFANTFSRAQEHAVKASKSFITNQEGLRIVESHYQLTPVSETTDLAKLGYTGFINDFYDDEGWWSLAWIRVFDVTGNAAYLSMAESIFEDMQGGLEDNTCGGGVWWDKNRTYKNAIANELYLSVAASLANRAPDADAYLAIAEDQWAWFKQSGLINDDKLINDGLIINDDGTCSNNGGNTWSYNQGVILGGLVELYKATGDSILLSKAVAIAEAAISALSVDGILHESCENDCGADGSQFKGIFMRNLNYLQLQVDRSGFRTFIRNNADSIWADNRTPGNYLGLNWAGPPSVGGGFNASTQSSAIDALVAAVAESEV